MRNLKKFLAVVVAIAVMMTAMVPAFAAETTTTASTISADAAMVIDLGVLKGSTTPDAAYLAKVADRMMVARMILRLKGVEADALKTTVDPKAFTDMKDTNADGKAILTYLKAHPEFGFEGGSTGGFGVKSNMSARAMYKVLLVNLGYAEADYAWDKIMDTAAKAGLTKIADADTKDITRDQFAVAIAEALKAKDVKTGKTFAETLVAAKLIDSAKAEKYGLISTATTATAAPATAKSIKVTFGKAVDTTKATFAVKSGASSISVTTAWNDAKTEATLTRTSNFAAGDYTVTIGGLTEIPADKATLTVTFKDQAVTTIDFIGDLVKNSSGDSATVKYVVKDQYGTDITKDTTLSGSSSVTGTIAGPSGSIDATNAKVTLNYNFAVDTNTKSVVVVLVHGATGVSKTATINVVAATTVDSFVFGDVKLPDGAKKIITNTAAAATIPVTVKDQYGNLIKTTSELNNAITLLSSDPTRVGFTFALDADSNPVINVNTSLNGGPAAAETVLCTAYVKVSGRTFPLTVKVEMPAVAKSVKLGTVDKATVASGDTAVVLPIQAFDQFGTELTKDEIASATNKAAIESMVSATSYITDPVVITDRNSKDYGKMQFDAVAEGTAMIVATSQEPVNVETKNVVVKAARVLTDVVAPSTIYMTQGATKSDIELKFYDQYGDEMTGDLTTASLQYKVSLEKVSGDTDAVTSSAVFVTDTAFADEDDLKTIPVTASATGTGTYKLVAKLVDNAVTTTVKSEAAVSIVVVKNNATGLTYGIKDVATLPGDQDYTNGSVYEKDLAVYAKDASGNEYTLATSDVIAISSTDENIVNTRIASGVAKVKGQDITANSNTANKTATVTVTFNTLDGVKEATTTVTVSPAAPATQEIKVITAALGAPTTDISSVTEKSVFEQATQADFDMHVIAKDQYGVWSDVDLTTATILVNSTNYAASNALVASDADTINPGTVTVGQDIKVSIIVGGKSKQIIVKFLS